MTPEAPPLAPAAERRPEICKGAPHAMLLWPGENESPDGEATLLGTHGRESVHPFCFENHELLEWGVGKRIFVNCEGLLGERNGSGGCAFSDPVSLRGSTVGGSLEKGALGEAMKPEASSSRMC